MQALIDIIAGLVALIAAAALSLFGVSMSTPETARPEIHRMTDCGTSAGSKAMLTGPAERAGDC